jgi:hypothetical protein
VTPVPEAITSFAADLDAAAVTEAAAKSGTMFPIKFDNQEAEVGRAGGLMGCVFVGPGVFARIHPAHRAVGWSWGNPLQQ